VQRLAIEHRPNPTGFSGLQTMREELSAVRPRSVGWWTSIDALPLDTVVERRDGYLVVPSPGNPSH
jgi:hypothetical protein